MALKATEVFTPGSFPTYTYVERQADRLEKALPDAIETPGQIVSLAGPSKSLSANMSETPICPEFSVRG